MALYVSYISLLDGQFVYFLMHLPLFKWQLFGGKIKMPLQNQKYCQSQTHLKIGFMARQNYRFVAVLFASIEKNDSAYEFDEFEFNSNFYIYHLFY